MPALDAGKAVEKAQTDPRRLAAMQLSGTSVRSLRRMSPPEPASAPPRPLVTLGVTRAAAGVVAFRT